MLTCRITETVLTFEWQSDLAVKGSQTYACTHHGKFTPPQLQVLADSTIAVCSRLSKSSYNTCFKGLSTILEKLNSSQWPAHNNVPGWQNIIVTIFENTIRTKKLKLQSRVSYWNSAAQIIKELSRMGVIPHAVRIPNAKSNSRTDENSSPPLGYQSEKIPLVTAIEEILPKKFLVELDLDKPDDLYLTQFKQELETSVTLVSNALNNYWEEILTTHSIGKALMDSIPALGRDQIIKANGIGADGIHVCAPSSPRGLVIPWLLTLLKHNFEKGLITAISATEFFKVSTGLGLGRVNKLFQSLKAICPRRYMKAKVANEYASRLIGLLSVVDCNAAIAVLVINNPVLTPESIGVADLYMENGDCYVQVDTEEGLVRFSVSKSRAGSRKVAYLNKISRDILAKVVECTATVRQLLKADKRPDWTRLFIYFSSRGPASRASQISNNNEDKNSLKTRLAADLTSIRGELDLSPRVLRATQGIITFLRTGSLAVTSLVLGNSIAVTESNYIPKWLVNRFANRTLRILAQKAIVVATHGHPWALAATDFTTPEQLHRFIVRILSEAIGNDPFAVVARRRLSNVNNHSTALPAKSGDLHFHINSEILAALYAYESQVATMPSEEQLKIHPETQLSHQAVCNIARLSRLAAELDIDDASESDFQISHSFCGGAWEELKVAHQIALDEIEYYNSLFVNVQLAR